MDNLNLLININKHLNIMYCLQHIWRKSLSAAKTGLVEGNEEIICQFPLLDRIR